MMEGNNTSVQVAQLKFSENLIFGFEVLSQRCLENGFQVIKDLSEFMKKRAQHEQEYVKQLSQFFKTKPGQGLFSKEVALQKENKTLREAVYSMLDKGVSVSDKHLEFSNKILNEICKNLDQWLKSKEPEKKKILAEGQKLIKNLSDLKQAAIKGKTAYDAAMKEAESLKDKLLQAEKDEINTPENKKLQQVTRKASQQHIQQVEKAKALDTAYQNAITKYNEELDAFQKEKMPAVLNQLQVVEDDRWNLIYTTLKSYRALQLDLLPAIDQQMSELNITLEKASIEEDYKEIVEANKKEDEAPLVYVPFKGKYTEQSVEQPSSPTVESSFSTKTAEEKLEDEGVSK